MQLLSCFFRAYLRHVDIFLCCLDGVMAEQIADGGDVRPLLGELRCE